MHAAPGPAPSAHSPGSTLTSEPTTTAAFFDMDETLLTVNSANAWVQHVWKAGEITHTDLMRSVFWLLGYKLAIIDMNRVARSVVRQYAGLLESDLAERTRTWFESEIRPTICPAVRRAVEEHQERGHPTVLLTASSPYLSNLVAQEVGLDAVLCTQFEVADGRLTGEIQDPFCYGAGKVNIAQEWADTHNIDLDTSYFYTDSFTDVPMLERVGHPVAVRPDPRLLRYARRHRIPIYST